MRVLVIIPAYNEAGAIGDTVAGVRRHCAHDIVVIDDGSADDTARRAAGAGAEVLRHPCNLGIGAAVQTGYLYALHHGYDLVIRQDGDGQHDPSYIPEFTAILERGDGDLIVGSRFLAREGFQSTLVRRIGIAILSVVSALVGTRTTDPTSGYWGINRRALAVLAHSFPDDYPETEAMLIAAAAGCRVLEVPVVMRERRTGRSSIGTLLSGFYMAKVILALLILHLRPRNKR